MSSTSVAAVRTALNQWLSAFNTHDIDALMALYDHEATYANNTSPLKSNLSEIRESFVSSFAILPTITFKEEAVIAEDSLGYITGRFSLQGKNPQDNSEIENFGRVVVIFRKSVDNKWKLVFDMDNSPPDVTRENV